MNAAYKLLSLLVGRYSLNDVSIVDLSLSGQPIFTKDAVEADLKVQQCDD